jgi:hypothetical protein
MHARIPPSERFWPKVEKSGPVPEIAGWARGCCWTWTGGGNVSNGGRYGQFMLSCVLRHPPTPRVTVKAHRFAWEERNGPLPTGLHLDHLCRNTLCVNPDHLEMVTPRENNLRSNNMAGRHSRLTHCKNGHEYSPSNTAMFRGKWRRCMTCRRQWSREEKARRKAERAAA